MCEFCIQHGEGKQWYLQMKNYSQELLHAPLTAKQKDISGFNTRLEWRDDDYKQTVIPAGGITLKQDTPSDIAEEPVASLSEEQLLERHKIITFGQVLPIEDVEKVLHMTDSITRLPCACRYFNHGLVNQRYCFGLGIDRDHMLGKFPHSSACLEVVSQEEAMKLMRKFDDEGLIHTVWSGITPFVSSLCNCDGDCSPYQHYIKERGVPRFFRAEYICQVDWDQCNGCKECMSQCQFGAQFYSSAYQRVSISPEHCFGCGVCRAACPQNAISIIPRVNSPRAASIW